LVSGRYLAPSFGYAKTRPMATNKKSFVLYCDLIHTIEHLSIKQRGDVFTWVLEYVNDKNPEPLEGLLAAVVEPIKQQLKRDLKKYEQRADRSRENGKKGGRPPKTTTTYGDLVKPKETQSVNSEPRKPDNVSVTVNDNDTVNVTDNKKKSIEERKAEFKNSLLTNFIDRYDNNLLINFFDYWTEASPGARKMRFEKEKAFDVSRRLKTWLKNESKFGNKMDQDNKASDAVNWFNS
jgi:hypothetical protein